MVPFDTLTAIAAPIDMVNVDTDQLTPIHKISKRGRERPNYAEALFYDQRFDSEGRKNTDFVLNQPVFCDANIIVAAENFGCGSSREHAVWALADFGIRAIIAPSFGDIFFQNCAANGLLAIRLDASICSDLRTQLHRVPGATITIDLPAQTVVAPDGRELRFDIDLFRKEMLIRGVDDIDLTFDYLDQIKAWETERDAQTPWTGSVTDRSRSSGPLPEETLA